MSRSASFGELPGKVRRLIVLFGSADDLQDVDKLQPYLGGGIISMQLREPRQDDARSAQDRPLSSRDQKLAGMHPKVRPT